MMINKHLQAILSIQRIYIYLFIIKYLQSLYRLVSIEDESGNIYEIRYNERYDPISITDGEGNITRIEYNQYWKVSRIIDPMGNYQTAATKTSL